MTLSSEMKVRKELREIEEREPEEVLTCGGCRIAPDLDVYNPAFDVTPHRYLTGIITGRGVVYPPFEMSRRKLLEVE